MEKNMNTVSELKDSYVINGGVFYLLGIMVMIPFQFYINSLQYWMYKLTPPGPPKGPPGPHSLSVELSMRNFRNNWFSMNTTLGKNIMEWLEYKNSNVSFQVSSRNSSKFAHSSYPMLITMNSHERIIKNDDISMPDKRTLYQTNFMSAFSVNFKVVMFLSLLACSVWTKRLPPPEKRLTWCFVALCVLFSVATIMSQINSTKMIQIFFVGAMISATLLNCFTGLGLASLYELITKFPINYYASIQSGHNICGVISSGLQVILLAFRLGPELTGVIYFSCGTLLLIVTTVYYYFTAKNSKYFIYRVGQNEQKKNVDENVKKVMLTIIFDKVKWYIATIIFIEGTTHFVYPGLVALVVSEHRDNVWSDVFFVPTISFLGFQVCNLIGRETARIIRTPKHGLILFILAALRIAFVPLLVFCNAQPRRNLPVYFGDNFYICILAVFAFTDGIVINTAIVAIPSMLEKNEKADTMVLIPLISSLSVTLTSALNIFLTNLI